MRKSILVKSVVVSVLSFASIAYAEKLTVNEIRRMCEQHPSEAQSPASELNNWLRENNNNRDCITVANFDAKKYDRLKDELIEKQQKNCLAVVHNQCDMKLSADDESKCVLHKDDNNVPDYAIFYNESKKIFSTIKGLKNYRCSIDQTTVDSRIDEKIALTQTKLFRGNLFMVTDGRVLFFDDVATLRELVSGTGNSYKKDEAFVQSLRSDDGGRTLTIVRRYSQNTDKTQDIEIPLKVLDEKDRTKIVTLDKKNKQTVYLRDGNQIIPVQADVIK